MTITGAVYPAIDLTAGERERGTMEALIASPIPRFALLLSKYVAVITVAMLTAVANLTSMWLTLNLTGVGKILLGEQGFSPWAMLQILPLLLIFACFFSAVLLALCSFARSFKEAQAYLIPVMLVSLAPGVLSLMPGLSSRRPWRSSLGQHGFARTRHPYRNASDHSRLRSGDIDVGLCSCGAEYRRQTLRH